MVSLPRGNADDSLFPGNSGVFFHPSSNLRNLKKQGILRERYCVINCLRLVAGEKNHLIYQTRRKNRLYSKSELVSCLLEIPGSEQNTCWIGRKLACVRPLKPIQRSRVIPVIQVTQVMIWRPLMPHSMHSPNLVSMNGYPQTASMWCLRSLPEILQVALPNRSVKRAGCGDVL